MEEAFTFNVASQEDGQQHGARYLDVKAYTFHSAKLHEESPSRAVVMATLLGKLQAWRAGLYTISWLGDG